MTVDELQGKVAILEKAVLELRFQYERLVSHGNADAADGQLFAPVTLTVKQFAGRVGMKPGWVLREITAQRIKAFGRRPYLIPGSELAKFI